MKTIEERAWEKYPEVIKHRYLAHIDINEEKRKMYIDIATEQKAIDDAEYVNKALMGKGSSINYYNQGYHDAIEQACELLDTYLMEIADLYDSRANLLLSRVTKKLRMAMEKKL